jgi:hypothetical protein
VLVLGYPEGNVELRSMKGELHSVTFDQVPSSPTSRIIPGPPGTLIIGYGNGVVGLWSIEDGALIKKHRLHGSVEHLLMQGSQFHAATDVGVHMEWNLEAFALSRCDLVRQIWDRTRVTWQAGQVVAQPPPRDDRCVKSNPGVSP